MARCCASPEKVAQRGGGGGGGAGAEIFCGNVFIMW